MFDRKFFCKNGPKPQFKYNKSSYMGEKDLRPHQVYSTFNNNNLLNNHG